jgi:hypothetical protein
MRRRRWQDNILRIANNHLGINNLFGADFSLRSHSNLRASARDARFGESEARSANWHLVEINPRA